MVFIQPCQEKRENRTSTDNRNDGNTADAD